MPDQSGRWNGVGFNSAIYANGLIFQRVQPAAAAQAINSIASCSLWKLSESQLKQQLGDPESALPISIGMANGLCAPVMASL